MKLDRMLYIITYLLNHRKVRAQELADQFENLSAETRRLAAIYERKQAALAALKKSLLHQAFAGGVVG